ncbi:MAG TPA: GspE/PulE family protein [Chthoniobacter sp.]|jgi:type II secretory ATPase GspE/PulE/Tfp pilus assembly ATPase PilB-like protein
MTESAGADTLHAPQLTRAFEASLREPNSADHVTATEPWVRGLLADARSARASDIHLDSHVGVIRIRFRIDGFLHDVATLPAERGIRLLRFLKVHAGLDPAPSLSPEDAHLRFDFDGIPQDLRLACAPCVTGDKITLRIHRRGPVTRQLRDLGLTDADRERIEYWLGDISGMFVVAGPVGSGKTTTLYALLSALHLTERHIVTIEDPVEYEMDRINQIEVDERRGLTYENCLRSVLRHDPDYILLGEIRDHESARVAMEASGMGRVVLSTMHGRNAAGVVTALRSLGIGDYEIAASLAFIVAQRLVRKLCPACRKEEAPSDFERRWLETRGETVPNSMWHAKGCEQCQRSGYFERTGIFEVVPLKERIYDLILTGEDEHGLRRELSLAGHRLLLQDGLEKVFRGITDLSELSRIGAQTYLQEPGKLPGA